MLGLSRASRTISLHRTAHVAASLAQTIWPTTAHPSRYLSRTGGSARTVSTSHAFPFILSNISIVTYHLMSFASAKDKLSLPISNQTRVRCSHASSSARSHPHHPLLFLLVFCFPAVASWGGPENNAWGPGDGARLLCPAMLQRWSRSCNVEGSVLQPSNRDVGTSDSRRYNGGMKSYNGCRILLEPDMRTTKSPSKAASVAEDARTSAELRWMPTESMLFYVVIDILWIFLEPGLIFATTDLCFAGPIAHACYHRLGFLRNQRIFAPTVLSFLLEPT